MKALLRADRGEWAPARVARAGRTRDVRPPTATALAGPASRCACGGGCSRCSGASAVSAPVDHRRPVRMSAPGDALERDADRAAATLLDDTRETNDVAGDRAAAAGALQDAAARRFGTEARLHTGPRAARLASAWGARAFTFGRDVVFAEGEFQPQTDAGRRLIAHELAHVAQQPHLASPMVQRQPDVIDMEPLTVRSTLQPTERAVSDLDRLTGAGVDPADMSVARDEETIRRNAPSPSRRLPFGAGSWNAEAILRALGQYDTMPGTDSDAIRCVQAVAMASRIVDGPSAVAGFLRAMILEGMMSRPQNPRERTAIEVLEHVIGRIESERATFGDLLWAQEALHDLFYNDVSGTPEPEILDRMAPALDLGGRSLVRMNVWCNGPQDVMTAASALQPGEQLLVNTWQVAFNTAFDQLEEQGVNVDVGRSTVVEINGRLRRIRRLDTSTRPAPTAIDTFRDDKSGHQLLVMKDGATGQLRLYEPEITDTGRHLEDLAADGSNFARYFRDMPEVGIYNYIQILGKLTPSALASMTSSFSSSTTP